MSLDEFQGLKKSPADKDLLEAYGRFKQPTIGDVNTDRRGLLDVKRKITWDAWKKDIAKFCSLREKEA